MILMVLMKMVTKSFEDQKGKGYVDLPIILSKLNINTAEPSALARSSKE